MATGSYTDAQGVVHYTATADAPSANPNANYFSTPTTTTVPTTNVNPTPTTTTTPSQSTTSTVQNMAYGAQNTTPTTTQSTTQQQATTPVQTTLTPEQAKAYYAQYGNSATPVSPQQYLEMLNSLKSTATPENQAEASSAIEQYQAGLGKSTDDIVNNFIQSMANMNPIESQIFQQLSNFLNTPTTQMSLSEMFQQELAAQANQTSLVDMYGQLQAQEGIQDLNLQLADINRIMDGTEDDIRSEITHVNGFATDSQVRALTAARNKTLLKQASYLSDVLNSKNDYVNQIMSLTQADRQAASDSLSTRIGLAQADRQQISDDLDRKLGIAGTLFQMSQSMTNAAKDNIKMIVDSVGWDGLAKSLNGNSTAISKVESLLGMSPGELNALAAYKKPVTEMEQLNLENQRLQNQKLQQDLNAAPSLSTQVVDMGNGKKILINSKTGEIITQFSGNVTDQTLQMAGAQQSIMDVGALLDDPNLGSAVGPNPAARLSFSNVFTGGKNNFVAGVEQLRSQLNLDSLIQAKANGATFGALSDQELKVLSNSATKLGSWAVKDKAGNVVGYSVGEEDFKNELDKINNFAKLDFILRGGDPTSVSVQEALDGTLWSKNHDGTYTQIM